MPTSRYELYRNEIIAKLSGKLNSESLGTVIAAVDMLSSKYDVIDRESAMVAADDMVRQTAALYLCCMRQDGKSNRTVDDYGRILTKFCDAMHGRAIGDIGTMDIRRYLLEYQQTHGVRNETLEHVRVVINGYFVWLNDNEYIAKNPCRQVKKIKCAKRTRTAICGEDVARLRAACRDERERVIIEVLVGSGLRVSELANLKLIDINFRDGSMKITGKGNKERITYLTPEAMVAIEAYVGNPYTDRNLIVKDNVRADGVTSRTIERVVNEIYKRANVSTDVRITPHVLRHTFATSLVKRGCPITSIQSMMGHSSVNTTISVYTHLDHETVRTDFVRHSAM